MASSYLFCILVLVFCFTVTNSDIEQDKKECADTVVGLATCLPYASGDAKAPTLDCCAGLRGVLKRNKKCLCVLIKDRDDPSLGLKINATRALGLPTTCNSPTDISQCTSLLHLTPKSSEAKIFEDYRDAIKGTSKNATAPTAATAPSAKITNEGGIRKRWLGVEMVSFIIASTMLHLLLNI